MAVANHQTEAGADATPTAPAAEVAAHSWMALGRARGMILRAAAPRGRRGPGVRVSDARKRQVGRIACLILKKTPKTLGTGRKKGAPNKGKANTATRERIEREADPIGFLVDMVKGKRLIYGGSQSWSHVTA